MRIVICCSIIAFGIKWDQLQPTPAFEGERALMSIIALGLFVATWQDIKEMMR